MSKSFVGDIGTEILIDMGADISDATTTNLYVKKPGVSSLVTWEATIEGTNYLKYTIEDGDLSVAGRYYIQPYLELTSWEGYGEIVSFDVHNILS